MPDCTSVDDPATVKPPLAPGRKYSVEPTALALVKAENARLGADGAVVSICTSCDRMVSMLPTLSTAA